MFYGEFFCASEHCPLHVRPGDPGVMGAGEWAETSEGLLVTRALDEQGRMICDLCHNPARRHPAPARLAG